ncbi:uncharacterized protein SCODWIG_00415 [Saccharomycodes ludwigii]|uniref:Nucleoporin NUP82 n=1 Tax=Saccharomycodes ludwigii TaxID=36035 RepID=A0A376B2E2_9ASCO|nr:hypothetical protein SCDLUD_003559 [Saccharomycodes ludwigii]KAH3900568.1 hypothetical protein SCDLUD_003559 [Saccharomycodes ludwigii]SSD58654.1 uncharacterized protein SCODWIG_00415 [Saccharomycodes ludwigii]
MQSVKEHYKVLNDKPFFQNSVVSYLNPNHINPCIILTPNNTIANRNNNSVVFINDLGECRVTYDIINFKNYKTVYQFNRNNTLNVKDFKFIEFSGELIAIIDTNYKLHILDIASTTNESSMLLEIFDFNPENNKIKQILWHPLSTRVLVLLMEDSSIVKYNTVTGETIYYNDFSVVNDNEGSCTRLNVSSIARTNINVSNVTFSKNDGGLRLYLLDQDENDIYSIYPFFPESTFKLKKSIILNIFDTSCLQYDSYLKDETIPFEIKNIFIRQSHFVSKYLYNALSDIDKVGGTDGVITDKLINIEIPEAFNTKEYGLQGPYKIAPFPDHLYSQTGNQLLTLDIEDGNELLCIGFDNSGFLLCFADLDSPMYWSSTDIFNYSDFNCSLTSIEYLTVQNCNKTSTEFKCIAPHTIVSHLPIAASIENVGNNNSISTGTYFIDTSSWSKVFSEAISKQDFSLLDDDTLKVVSSIQNFGEKKIISCGGINLSSSENQHIDIICTLSDESVILVHTKNEQLEKEETTLKKLLLSQEQNAEGQSLLSVYHPAFSKPLDGILNMQHELKKSLQQESFYKNHVLSPYLANTCLLDIDIESEEYFKVIGILSEQLGDRLTLTSNLAYALYQRIMEQQYELRRQLSCNNMILNKQDDFKQKNMEQEERLAKIVNENAHLSERIESLQKTLKEKLELLQNNNNDMPLKTVEIEWFRSLKNDILEFNKMVLKQQTFKEQLSYIQAELKTYNGAVVVDSKRNNDIFDFKELQELLKIDGQIVRQCNDELVHAANELDIKLNDSSISP